MPKNGILDFSVPNDSVLNFKLLKYAQNYYPYP